MRKFMVVFVISAVFLAGCGANNVVEKKDAPQDSKNNSEVDANQETTTDLNKELVPLSTKTFEGIWKLTTYQDPESVKKITEWKPKPLEYKGELHKKWSMDAWYQEDKKLRYHIYEPYRSYPDCWGIFDLFLCNKENDYYISGFLNPDTGEFSKNTNSLGITDGENIYVNDSSYYNPSCCVRLKDKKVLWETIAIGGFCSYPQPVHISGNCLINILHCTNPSQNVRRINTATGKPVWFLELMDSAQLSGRYSIFNAESNLESIFIEVGEIFRNPINDEYIDSETKGYCKINPKDGSVRKVTIGGIDTESRLEGIDDTLWITLEDGTIYRLKDDQSQPSLFEPNKELKTSHKIKSLTIAGSSNGKILFYAAIADKNNEHGYLLYEPKTGETKELFYQNILSNNRTFYVDERDRFVGIDLETGETTWTLLKEKGKNPSIRLIDWRGVLVYQDNQLACYAPK